MEVHVTSTRHAWDEGEFESREDAIAYVAGAMLAFEGAERFYVDLERRKGKTDSNAPGFFMWSSPPYWYARVSADWPDEREPKPNPPLLDLTAIRDALVDVAESAHAPRGDER